MDHLYVLINKPVILNNKKKKTNINNSIVKIRIK